MPLEFDWEAGRQRCARIYGSGRSIEIQPDGPMTDEQAMEFGWYLMNIAEQRGAKRIGGKEA